MLKTRILSALVLGPFFLAALYFGGLALQLLCVVLAVLALRECLNLGGVPHRGIIDTLSIVVLTFAFLYGHYEAALLVLVLTPLTTGLSLPKDDKNMPIFEGAAAAIGFKTFALVYCAFPFACFYLVRQSPDWNGRAWLLLMTACTWANDSGAYFTGRALGKNKMTLISPKKTIEGALGGVVSSLLVAFIANYFFVNALPLGPALTLGALAAVFGILGDLAESLLKRSGGIKDSGTIIPGHGGILDRFDAMLFVVPIGFVFLRLAAGLSWL